MDEKSQISAPPAYGKALRKETGEDDLVLVFSRRFVAQRCSVEQSVSNRQSSVSNTDARLCGTTCPRQCIHADAFDNAAGSNCTIRTNSCWMCLSSVPIEHCYSHWKQNGIANMDFMSASGFRRVLAWLLFDTVLYRWCGKCEPLLSSLCCISGWIPTYLNISLPFLCVLQVNLQFRIHLFIVVLRYLFAGNTGRTVPRAQLNSEAWR